MKSLTISLLALAASVAACATAPPPKVVYQTVETPVPVSCVPKTFAPTPVFTTPEALAAEPDGPRRYERLAADWLARVARMTQTEPLLDICRRATQ